MSSATNTDDTTESAAAQLWANGRDELEGAAAAIVAAVSKPAWRGWLHAAAAVVATAGGAWLIHSSSPAARPAVAVYVTCLVALFAVSASYHRFARTERARNWLRRADHAMIFLLIAGTYTPLCVLGMERSWGRPALVAVWAICIAGAAAKLFSFERFERAGSYLYGAIGWAGLILAPTMYATMPGAALATLAAGGVCFSAGAIVLARNSPNPAPAVFGYHEIWHTFTIAGAALHFATVEMLAL